MTRREMTMRIMTGAGMSTEDAEAVLLNVQRQSGMPAGFLDGEVDLNDIAILLRNAQLTTEQMIEKRDALLAKMRTMN